MGRDNRDRYGHRHRRDSGYEAGESMPGTVGDSEGTFHDRASSDNTVIVDGKAKSYESHKRSNAKSDSLAGRSRNGASLKGLKNSRKNRSNNASGKSSRGSMANLDGTVVEVTVDRVSGSGNAIAEFRGRQVHVEGGTPGETYEVRLQAASGYWTGQPRVKE